MTAEPLRSYLEGVVKSLHQMSEKIDAQAEVLRALNEQQSKMNNLLMNWCEAMEEELGEDDRWGLFDGDDDDAA